MTEQSIAQTIYQSWLAAISDRPTTTLSEFRNHLRQSDIDYCREKQPTAFVAYFHFADGSLIKVSTYYDHKSFSNQKMILLIEPFNSVADFNKAVFNVTNGVAITKSQLA